MVPVMAKLKNSVIFFAQHNIFIYNVSFRALVMMMSLVNKGCAVITFAEKASPVFHARQ